MGNRKKKHVGKKRKLDSRKAKGKIVKREKRPSHSPFIPVFCFCYMGGLRLKSTYAEYVCPFLVTTNKVIHRGALFLNDSSIYTLNFCWKFYSSEELGSKKASIFDLSKMSKPKSSFLNSFNNSFRNKLQWPFLPYFDTQHSICEILTFLLFGCRGVPGGPKNFKNIFYDI